MAAKRSTAGEPRKKKEVTEAGTADILQIFSKDQRAKMSTQDKLRLIESLRDHRKIDNWKATMDRLPPGLLSLVRL